MNPWSDEIMDCLSRLRHVGITGQEASCQTSAGSPEHTVILSCDAQLKAEATKLMKRPGQRVSHVLRTPYEENAQAEQAQSASNFSSSRRKIRGSQGCERGVGTNLDQAKGLGQRAQ